MNVSIFCRICQNESDHILSKLDLQQGISKLKLKHILYNSTFLFKNNNKNEDCSHDRYYTKVEITIRTTLSIPIKT